MIVVVDGCDGLTPDMLRERKGNLAPGDQVKSNRSGLIYTVTHDIGDGRVMVTKDGWDTSVMVLRKVLEHVHV